MEALWKSLRKGSSTAWTGEDHVYENIEAPKFVDFSAPDRSRPDDRSWFCTRIGCDQNHDEVDPDVLHKNFVLRVMAARSPNVRLQKALSRHDAPSAKCPRSAPAKSAKSRIGMLAEKAGSSARLKNYPVACLSSSTPKPPAKRPPAAAKALSTPRNRARPTGEEAFRSVKISKPPEPLLKNRAAVKVLSFHTPKKSEKGTCAGKAPIPEISAGMKKLNMGTLRSDNAIDRDACRLLEAEECPERALPSSMTPSEDPTGVKSSPKAEAEEPDVFEDEPMEGSSEFDENKENASVIHAAADRDENRSTFTSGMENRQKNSCDGPRKATAASGNNHHKSAQGAKYRALKPTNPKPFRLRTDERGILREKNLERGKPEKEVCIIKPGGKPEQKSSSLHAQRLPALDLQRLLKPLRGGSKGTAPEEEEEEEKKKKKKKKSTASLLGGAEEGIRRAPPSVLRPREETAISMASTASAKKALTVPKAPKFNKVNVPKGCIRRFDLAN